MLKIDHVSKKLNTFHLHDISLELPSGHIMGLIGENGAGKTTLIHILSGLYSKDQGEITFNGMVYGREEAEIKQEIGVVIHGGGVFDRQDTLIRNADYYGRFYRNYDGDLLRTLLEQFQLDGRKKYRHLSKGEALKFAMAFALSHKPRLLLLDEPTANFDMDFRKQFFDLLRDYTADGENSVILSTHITSDIDKVADYLLYLQKGRQLLYDDVEGIRGNYRIAAGEEYRIKLLKDRVIHMETGKFGCKALVYNSKKPFDPALKVWEPSIEEAAVCFGSVSYYAVILQITGILFITYICGILCDGSFSLELQAMPVYGEIQIWSSIPPIICYMGGSALFAVCAGSVSRTEFWVVLGIMLPILLPIVAVIQKHWKTIRSNFADYEMTIKRTNVR